MHTYACTGCTVKLANICIAVTCTNGDEHNHPQFMDFAVPGRIYRVPLTKYLKTFMYFIFISIHLSFCVFISQSMQTCLCQCVHVLCKSCLLRRWIKQQVHLICKALQGKHTQNKTHTHMHRGLHTASKSFPSQNLFLGALTNHSFSDINLFYSYPQSHTNTQTDACTLCSELHSLVVILHSYNALCSLFFWNRICSR